MKKLTLLIFTILILIFFAAGCRGKNTLAAQSVEEYFQAILEKDQSMLISNTCSSYEQTAMLDFNTFAIVETSLENFSCQTTGTYEDGLTVGCQGSIKASFGNEIRSFDLSNRIYQVIEENGNWLVCGHTDVQ